VKNTIQISVEFSFKGETFKPEIEVDLDQLIRQDGSIPDLHHLLALEGNIDTYSYAFEVMQQSEPHFDKATGLASDYLLDGRFDLQRYIQKRKEVELHDLLSKIAKDILDIDDLADEPKLKNALMRAYQLGQKRN